jgi:hypothetical protein
MRWCAAMNGEREEEYALFNRISGFDNKTPNYMVLSCFEFKNLQGSFVTPWMLHIGILRHVILMVPS